MPHYAPAQQGPIQAPIRAPREPVDQAEQKIPKKEAWSSRFVIKSKTERTKL